jgi:hypothetical protein
VFVPGPFRPSVALPVPGGRGEGGKGGGIRTQKAEVQAITRLKAVRRSSLTHVLYATLLCQIPTSLYNAQCKSINRPSSVN